MSGHNKWSSIKHKKGAADVKRSKIFSPIEMDTWILFLISFTCLVVIFGIIMAVKSRYDKKRDEKLQNAAQTVKVIQIQPNNFSNPQNFNVPQNNQHIYVPAPPPPRSSMNIFSQSIYNTRDPRDPRNGNVNPMVQWR